VTAGFSTVSHRRGRASKSPFDPVSAGLWLGLMVAAVIWLLPLVVMVFTSLKSRHELLIGSPFLPPRELSFQNYADAWRRGHLAEYGLNSMVIAFVKVPVGLFISSLAAFALTRLRFPFRKAIFLFIVVGALIPVQIALSPLFAMVLKAGLLNTYAGVLLPYIAFGIPYQVFLLRGFFASIPRELDEAAAIDGCSAFRFYWRVLLPLSLPALAALAILDFVGTWNEFSIALVMLQSQSAWTLPLALQSFQGLYGNNYNQLTAAILMSVLPVVIVYLIFQRYFVAGLTTGAVKG
jgi:raffinose/stachyose/melibiose transport system permease protein